MTTKGAVQNQRLPSAPMDSCPALNGSFTILNSTLSDGWLNTTVFGTTSDYFPTTMGSDMIEEEP